MVFKEIAVLLQISADCPLLNLQDSRVGQPTICYAELSQLLRVPSLCKGSLLNIDLFMQIYVSRHQTRHRPGYGASLIYDFPILQNSNVSAESRRALRR